MTSPQTTKLTNEQVNEKADFVAEYTRDLIQNNLQGIREGTMTDEQFAKWMRDTIFARTKLVLAEMNDA